LEKVYLLESNFELPDKLRIRHRTNRVFFSAYKSQHRLPLALVSYQCVQVGVEAFSGAFSAAQISSGTPIEVITEAATGVFMFWILRMSKYLNKVEMFFTEIRLTKAAKLLKLENENYRRKH